MTGASSPPGEGIFISYRRADAAYPAGWLFDLVAARFGAARVFKDVDSIQPGDDFLKEIKTAVGSCTVLLAVIGKQWLAIASEDGRRRLDHPDDPVRWEIESALERGIRVIPVLVDGAPMPTSAQLPASLSRLAPRQAVELSPFRFNADASRLLGILDKELAHDPGLTAPPTAAISQSVSGEQNRTTDTTGLPATQPAPDPPEDDFSDSQDPGRMLAMLRRFDVPAGEGLNREQASQAFAENGYDPRSFGGWVRRGWIARDDDHRYLTGKGRQWVAEQGSGTPENWRLILAAARALTAAGQAPFTRMNAYEWIWRRYSRADHDRPSLDPTFQGMISNATGGPVSAAGTPLHRVRRGLYVLTELPAPAHGEAVTGPVEGETGQVSARGRAYEQFWHRLISQVHALHPSWTTPAKPPSRNSVYLNTDIRWFSYGVSFGRKGLCSELFIRVPDNAPAGQRILEYLESRRSEMENIYGCALNYEDLSLMQSGRIACRLADYHPGSIGRAEEHQAYLEWFLSAQTRLRSTMDGVGGLAALQRQAGI